jgi:Ca2+-binding RTX toxin-like protein
MKRFLPIAIVLAAALAWPVGSVSSAGQIVIDGADSGSHMYLRVAGNTLEIHGYMAPNTPTGCRFTDFRRDAVCSLSGVDSIEAVMGPSDDKIEVLDSLPVPLTTYLGKGSDKLIANNEPDTCYPQGTRRNRCIGGGGNDVCITGPRNSDCVGGPGNDYCRHSTGSDGCWGGPGDDTCIMGPGKDGCHGDGGNDILHEGSGSGKLYGGSGNDQLYGDGSPDKLFGGSGADHLYGGGAADKLYGGGGRDYCDGQGPTGKDYDCEYGPMH